MSWAHEWNEFETLVWADNIFLTTDSAAEAACRTREVASVFKARKVAVQSELPGNLSEPGCGKGQDPIVLHDGNEFSWVHTLQVLGCFFGDGTGSTEARNMFSNSGFLCVVRRFHKKSALVDFTLRWVGDQMASLHHRYA